MGKAEDCRHFFDWNRAAHDRSTVGGCRRTPAIWRQFRGNAHCLGHINTRSIQPTRCLPRIAPLRAPIERGFLAMQVLCQGTQQLLAPQQAMRKATSCCATRIAPAIGSR